MANGTIRTMEVFADVLRDMVESSLGAGYRVEVREITKNNGTRRTGMVIMDERTNMAPAIYLEEFYCRYREGRTAAELCRDILGVYRESRVLERFDTGMLADFSRVKDRICFKLVNAGRNRELLAGVPSVRFHDLAVIFYIMLGRDESGMKSVTVKDSFMEVWNVDRNTLSELALENTQRLFPEWVVSMEELLAEQMAAEGMGDVLCGEMSGGFPIYIASNREKLNGAGVILYPDFLKGFADRIGGNFYLLPSSLHEMILIPAIPGMEAEALKQMVVQVNEEQVAPDEFLSNHVYYYDRDAETVKML